MNIPFARPRMPSGVTRAWRAMTGGAAALMVWAASASAQTPAPAAPQMSAEVLARALALAGEAARAVAPRGARIEVLPGQLDTRLTLAPCARVEPYLPAGVPAWGRTRLGLRCDEGARRWNVFLPMTVQAWAPALVTTASLPAGAKLSDSQLSTSVVDWAASSTPPFSPVEPLAGRTLARAVAAGQALRATDMQARQWFALGDNVRIQATGSGFSIVAEGKALAAGVEGQSVRVRVVNERSESGPVLVGRPIGDHRVEVSL